MLFSQNSISENFFATLCKYINMSKYKLSFAATILLCAFFLSSNVSAANIKSEFTSVKFYGEIQSGDADRLVTSMLKSAIEVSKNNYLNPIQIEVNSLGGDVKEALKIASVVKAAYLDVNVVMGVNGSCASSCFLIFLAGQSRSASGTETIAKWGPTKSFGAVGIHRPYYRSLEGGPASAKMQEDAMQEVESYLQSQRMPRYLIDEMMSHASNDIYWLKDRDLKALGQYKPAVEEELIAKCSYNSKQFADLSIKDFAKYQSVGGIGDCVSTYLVKTYSPLRNAVFDKMRTGWRPWKD
jgi:hypothetical protein